MTARLDPASHAWMNAAPTRAVMDALCPDGEDTARFVGGCVRNAIMGRPVDDIDIATILTPDIAGARLEAAGMKVIPTGIDHGTITAVFQGQPFEITTLRKDVQTFGRRAEVAYSTDWAEDAARRDFRLNAIYCAPSGALFDPFGGVEDARAGQVIFIGEARERIAEDHLRILRFYRFNAWYGGEIDPAGQAACAQMAQTLNALSAERVWKELKKLLAAPDPSAALKAMQEGHVLDGLVPGTLDFKLLLSLINADRGMSRAPDPLLRVAALAGGDEAAMTALLGQMKASNAEKSHGYALCARGLEPGVSGLKPGAASADLARAVYAIGAPAAAGRLRLEEARGAGDASAALEFISEYPPPVFPLQGRDLLEAGFERGPQLGAILERLRQSWIDSAFTLDRDALLARARSERS